MWVQVMDLPQLPSVSICQMGIKAPHISEVHRDLHDPGSDCLWILDCFLCALEDA